MKSNLEILKEELTINGPMTIEEFDDFISNNMHIPFIRSMERSVELNISSLVSSKEELIAEDKLRQSLGKSRI